MAASLDVTALGSIEVLGEEISLDELVLSFGVLLATVLLALVARRGLLKYAKRESTAHSSTWYTVSRVLGYTIVAIGVLAAVSALGVPLSRFAWLAGALGVGLGFGLQTIFSNFISGLILLFDRTIEVGDFVELESGVTGEVRDIRIRATRIVTNDNIDIIVPNSEFVTSQVVNWTHRDVSRRLRVPFGVAYGTDKNIVKRAALEAASELPFTLTLDGPHRPQVWLTEFGDSSLNYELVVWVNGDATVRPAAVTAAYNWALHSALQRHDIEIPFPQQDVHVRSIFGLTGQDARDALGLQNAGITDEPEANASESDNDAVDDVKGAGRDMPGAAEDLAE
ncbi:mechanosensitive ion channel MscS [Rhodococcus sp. AW25M09]|uniref:mechanosensitive ion channel family protein n=1 Tax=Rhodococcus sp. AW25M09 TaxID=1268303 RepID=UPI0002ACDA63|nr:mechanosensitive ion channel domain-containing protein [Rhodococcus sp. AW25M09]CCQ16441.1 mechanosensitive ion channel MscS [Rhodococcus sp. AW25M09]